MPQNIMAIYEHGLLRPLEPLSLAESHQVQIQIRPAPVVDKTDQLIPFLVQVGLLTPPSRPLKSSLISRSERRKLANALAQSAKQTLSEIVIEDRGQW